MIREIDSALAKTIRETDLALSLPKKEFGKKRFIYNGASHWNNFPYEAKSSKSLVKLIQNDIKAKNLLKLTRLP